MSVRLVEQKLCTYKSFYSHKVQRVHKVIVSAEQRALSSSRAPHPPPQNYFSVWTVRVLPCSLTGAPARLASGGTA